MYESIKNDMKANILILDLVLINWYIYKCCSKYNGVQLLFVITVRSERSS